MELNDFYNDGFGWICKHCERELKSQNKVFDQTHSRLMREGMTEVMKDDVDDDNARCWEGREDDNQERE